ncbi:MAG: hypothetical protein LBC97_15650 [Bifidobacteriaceae bacterium]|nr:hypothetical protein [Bifidobacteriaceae bacterium]
METPLDARIPAGPVTAGYEAETVELLLLAEELARREAGQDRYDASPIRLAASWCRQVCRWVRSGPTT